ncbi:MAG: hypothetical protein RBU29_06190 [bacterium]|jgi:hypothetical protein|nr:hypothetical protein [bacterium]
MRRCFSFFLNSLILLAACLSASTAIPPAGSLRYSAQNIQVEYTQDTNSYTLTYTDSQGSYRYEITPDRTTNRVGSLSIRYNIDQENRLSPIFYGGIIIRDATNQFLNPEDRVPPASTKIDSKDWIENNRVHLVKTTDIGGNLLTREYIFSLRGKTLVLEGNAPCAGAAAKNIAGIDFGRSRFMKDPTVHHLPSVPFPLVQTHNDIFMSLYIDPFLSSLGQYDLSASDGSNVTISASNTPAYFRVDSDGNVPNLQFTAYVTISRSLADILPAPAAKTNPSGQRFRNSVILDLHENSLAHPESGSFQLIRRWDAPEDGIAHLEGAVSLQEGEKATFEVHYTRPSDGQDHILFSQILGNSHKTSTGIQGQFPVSKGDQLRFVAYGPGVMTGNELGLNIQIKHNNTLYRSIQDFSSTQGENNWYYEWGSSKGPAFLLWNETTLRWEHPETRAYQTATGMVPRTGQHGDAYLAAAQFLQSLQTLGLHNLAFILRGWDQYASTTLAEADAKNTQLWGTAQSYRQVTDLILNAGNQLIHALPAPATKAETLTAHQSQLLQAIQTAKTASPFSAVILPTSILADPDAPLFYNPEAGTTGEWSSRTAWNSIQRLVEGLRTQTQMPILAWGESRTQAANPLLTPWVDGLFAPIDHQSNTRNLVDEEIIIGRKAGTRIGLGSYSHYSEEAEETTIDPRMFPFDQYWTTTVAYARVPYFSDALWYPGLTPRDLRARIMEFVNLMQPVATEYLNPQHEVKSVLYYYNNIRSATTERVLADGKEEDATRVKIEYSNQLTIHANRSAEEWKLNEKTISAFTIDRDGFMAENPQSRLVSLIGTQGYLRFSACSTPNSEFLHSRTGKMLTFRSLATDGMIKLSNTPYPGKQDLACLLTRELRQSDLTPILLSNTRIDAVLHWLDLNMLEIKCLASDESSALLEYYGLPQTWFHDKGQAIRTTRNPGTESEKPAYFSLVENSGKQGIRIPDLKPSETLRISFNP